MHSPPAWRVSPACPPFIQRRALEGHLSFPCFYHVLAPGNLATASPISDMNPLLAACGADVVLNSVRGGERRIKVRDFFLGWVALLVDTGPSLLLLSVVVVLAVVWVLSSSC